MCWPALFLLHSIFKSFKALFSLCVDYLCPSINFIDLKTPGAMIYENPIKFEFDMRS